MKKILAVLLSAAMLISLAACSSSNESESSETTSSVSETETESSDVTADEETTENAESSDPYAAMRADIEAQAEESEAELETENSSISTVKNEYDSFYLDWKYTNWESASEADREKCINAYMGYFGDLMNMWVSDEDRSEEQMSRLYTSLENALIKNPDFTVKEILVYSVANSGESSESSEASE